MYSHGNHVAELQLLDNAICVHRDYTEAKSRVTAFPDGPDQPARQCWIRRWACSS
jgi:hypothetical protein